MTKMAAAFNTNVADLENELIQLILDGQINARIDSHNKVPSNLSTIISPCPNYYTSHKTARAFFTKQSKLVKIKRLIGRYKNSDNPCLQLLETLTGITKLFLLSTFGLPSREDILQFLDKSKSSLDCSGIQSIRKNQFEKVNFENPIRKL